MSHADISNKYKETDHMDPISYFSTFGKTMDMFRKDVQIMLDKLNTPPPLPILSWQDVLNKCTNDPDKWINGINTAVTLAKDNSDLGDLEIFQYLPLLVLKIWELKK